MQQVDVINEATARITNHALGMYKEFILNTNVCKEDMQDLLVGKAVVGYSGVRHLIKDDPKCYGKYYVVFDDFIAVLSYDRWTKLYCWITLYARKQPKPDTIKSDSFRATISGKPSTVYITSHAVKRYRERIDTCNSVDVDSMILDFSNRELLDFESIKGTLPVTILTDVNCANKLYYRLASNVIAVLEKRTDDMYIWLSCLPSGGKFIKIEKTGLNKKPLRRSTRLKYRN